MVAIGLSALESKPKSRKQSWWLLLHRAEFEINHFSRDYSTQSKNCRSLLTHISRFRQFLHDTKTCLETDAALSILYNRLPAELVEMVTRDSDVPDEDAVRASYIGQWPHFKCSLLDPECRVRYHDGHHSDWLCPQESTKFYWSPVRRAFLHTHQQSNEHCPHLCGLVDCQGHLYRRDWQMRYKECIEAAGDDAVLLSIITWAAMRN